MSVSRAYTSKLLGEQTRGNMAELEEILQKLLVPDSTVIQQVNDSLTVHPSITLLFTETHVGVI